MDDRALSRVAARLLRGGVAPRHVRRCVEEIRSHRAELIAQLRERGHGVEEAAAEADSRLGSPDDFCAATLARPELRGWAGRAPWLVFTVLPVAAFIAIGVALVGLLVASIELMSPAAKTAVDPGLWRLVGGLLVALVQWLLPLGICGVLLAIAWRSRSAPAWPAVGMVLIAALAAAANLGFVGPQAGAQGELSVGIGYPPRELARSVLLIGIAVACALVTFVRARRDEPA